MLKLAVLFGGLSNEHSISCLSASSILKNADQSKYDLVPVGITRDGRWFLYENADPDKVKDGSWEREPGLRRVALSPDRETHGFLPLAGGSPIRVDVCFPVLHGFGGEDGTIQGLLTLAGIPFVGPGVAASACSMDKSLTKIIVDTTGVRQAAYAVVLRPDYEQDAQAAARAAADKLHGIYPMFVKPCSSGSSVGVARADDFAGLVAGLAEAFRWDTKVLVEEFIDGHEIECAVLGNADPVASTVGEIAPTQEFYTFDAKYNDASSALYTPAHISEKAIETVRQNALRVYTALGCRGLSRVDFFCTYRDEEIVFNEINTIPGFTDISMYPKLFAHAGLSYPALIDRLVELALEDAHG